MKAIFLDIDGVLNGHEKHESGYCGICPARARLLNKVLRAVPECMLVISSSWRYLILEGQMTLIGFEQMLLAFGVDCRYKVRGHTRSDETCNAGKEPAEHDRAGWDIWGRRTRVKQIECYIEEHAVTHHVVLDDLDMGILNAIVTDSSVGLTDEIAAKVIEILNA